MARVLIVDDEIAIRRLLRNTLEREGHAVSEAGNGHDAVAEARATAPEAILLDLGLPDRDGLSLIPLLRTEGRVILVVSAREATAQKVAALDLGADDYVTKPFDTDELLARLRVALRHRSSGDAPPGIVTRGDLVLDVEHRAVTRAGQALHLTRKEYDVLLVLARHIGRVVTHDRLIAAAWRADEDPRIEYLRILIRNLRQKIEAPEPVGSVISNELGVGYRLRPDA